MATSSIRIRLRIERSGAGALHWYSARLRFAILTDRHGLERYLDSVLLLRAPSRQVAFEQALAQGRGREQGYQNQDGFTVRWRLAGVMSLDELADGNLHGTEILTMPVEAGAVDAASFGWDHEFQPEQSIPEETRV